MAASGDSVGEEEHGRPLWRRVLRRIGPPPAVARFLRRRMPRRLFPRSLLIIILPMLVLQSVVAAVFMDRHWENMTRRLSQATASEIATIVELIERFPDRKDEIVEIARERFFTGVRLMEGETLPRPAPKPFFSLLDRELSANIGRLVGKPFWIDTIGRSSFVEIRIKLDGEVLQIVTRRSQTYASNSHITLVWMGGASLVLIAIAILFLRNQVRPIQKLAAAAERFGRGQPLEDFRPYGALEVRQAAWAFIDMRRRIERQLDQRTAMLAGVSHDLRTMLTRFRLELALLEDTTDADVKQLIADVDAMQAMLEDYLAFARTETDEHVDAIDVAAMVEDLAAGARRAGRTVTVSVEGEAHASVRPNAFRRMLANLVDNATHNGTHIAIAVAREEGRLAILVDDDGPGLPASERENVFRPFYRLDPARNQNRSGTGLGLTIARDIARKHGGDIRLADAPLGGLRAEVVVPQ